MLPGRALQTFLGAISGSGRDPGAHFRQNRDEKGPVHRKRRLLTEETHYLLPRKRVPRPEQGLFSQNDVHRPQIGAG
jgi:hypothetical protein